MGIALVEQSAVPVVRVDHAPLIGVFEFPITKPDKRFKAFPVASSPECVNNFETLAVGN